MIDVDGSKVAASGTVLEVCRSAGAKVPTLCHDSRSGGGGHCRACLVEVDGRAVPACTTPARDATSIRTDTPRLRDYRRDLGELMASEATPRGKAAAFLASAGVTGERYASVPTSTRRDSSHPYLRFDLAACIKCRLCMSVCDGVQGQFVYAFAGRGAQARLSWGERAFSETPCVSCGACASACPSGAISDRDRDRASHTAHTVTRTTCSYCGVGCQLEVHSSDDAVQYIEGARSASVNRGHLCVKGRYAHSFVHHPDRLTTPLVRRGGKLEACSWEEALALVAAKFAEHRGALAGLSSSRCTNEENYLLQKWMRAGLGTHNVDCCARVCHAPTAAGMRRSFGTGAATNSYADIERADLILVSGSNSTEAHPIVGARIKERVLAGAKLLVIDPRRTELAELADVHLALRPGTNVWLLNSLACVLVEEQLVRREFVDTRTSGWNDFERHVRRFRPEDTEATTCVPATLVRKAARLYASAARPLQSHGLGMTEHYQGSESVMLLCNLALLVGAVGREGVGVNPLRGQNNVQGAADMGCQPDLLTGYANPLDPAVQARFSASWGRPLPTEPGLTLPRMYEAMEAGTIRALFVLGEDVVQTDPSSHVDKALAALDFLVVQEIFLSETAKLAHLVLPGASFLEKDGTFTNGERRIQRVRKVLEPRGQARADWEVLCSLMAATGYPQSFTHPKQILAEIASLTPSFAGVSFERLEPDGLQWPVPHATHPGTPILHTETFSNGRAQLACVEPLVSPSIANVSEEDYPLRLTTGRVLEHYNSGSMTRRGENLRLCSRDELELCAADAQRFGVKDGERVLVESPFGEARVHAHITERMRSGDAFLTFHFPESGTNHLMSKVLDRLADTPEYKVTPIRVRRLEA